MLEELEYCLTLPKSKIKPNTDTDDKTQETTEKIASNQSIFLMGANGSGKTRLGAWIEMESPEKEQVHRISAQKSLSMPDSSTPSAIDGARKMLLYGQPEVAAGNETHTKKYGKWQQKPATFMLNDFVLLMNYLFSEETELNAKHKIAQKKETVQRIEPPESNLDKTKKIWEKILSHRQLIICGNNIRTQETEPTNNEYNASEMSDGERVVFYLIGQCLSAPENGILVIDEPELHLHKAIQIPLWNEIEKMRSDCLFVYLTHDVDFAAAKVGSTRIWVKAFDGNTWEWETVNDAANLPEALLLEVLGSRKPIVFVEGTDTSLDAALYRELLPDFLVLPQGSCEQVIQSVKGFKANNQLSHLDIYGIIDRDRRTDAEIKNLEEQSIFVLLVAEVENLFCVKEVLQLASRNGNRNADEDFQIISKAIFTQLQQEIETQVSLHVANEIKYQLNLFNVKATGKEGLVSELQRLTDQIKVKTLYDQTLDDFNRVIENKDFEKLLTLYNRKGLSLKADAILGFKNGELQKWILRAVKDQHRNEITEAMSKYFGNFRKHMVLDSHDLKQSM